MAEPLPGDGPGTPFWLYTHIPFCPQICNFCQCSTSLRKSDRPGRRRISSGSTARSTCWPPPAPAASPSTSMSVEARRTSSPTRSSSGCWDAQPPLPFRRRTADARFEFLPSSLRPETLPLVRAFGFNRLSCGVQSWSGDTLKTVNRSAQGLDDLGHTIQTARYARARRGQSRSHPRHRQGEQRSLSRRPAPGAGPPSDDGDHPSRHPNADQSGVRDHRRGVGRARRLRDRCSSASARPSPAAFQTWNGCCGRTPGSWSTAVSGAEPDFSYWYYSDNERIHIDMLSVGRFAHSNILGQICYENLSHADRYDPSEASYHAFRSRPASMRRSI